MRLRLLSGAAIAALLLTLTPASLAADAPTMSPITGPPTGGTVVVISGGSGYTDSTTVTICNVTVGGFASKGGTTLTFATPAPPNPACSLGPATVTTNNPSTDGLPSFTYVSAVVAGAEGLTGTVRTAGGSPKAGADVWLIQTYPTIIARTTTDANGHYQLAAPAGDYYEAVALTQDPPTGGYPAYHEVQFINLTVAAGGTTLLDWLLPEMSMQGNCSQTSCTVHVSISGFGALEPVKIYLNAGTIIVQSHTFQLDLGTLTTNASGAASGAFTFAKPASDGYYATAGPSHPVSYVKTTYSRETLHVQPVPSARSWTATISGAGLSGRASLTVPTTGWATAAFWLYRLKAGVSVSARIVAGATCDATGTTIKRLPGYTTTIGGTWRQRWIFDGPGLVRLGSAIRRGTPLWFDVGAGGSRVCTRLAPAP